VPLLMTLKYIWRSFQPRLSFPRPFQLSLASFRFARSSSNSWASCYVCAVPGLLTVLRVSAEVSGLQPLISRQRGLQRSPRPASW